MAERKLRVFLCHSSQDKPIVRELYQRLLAEDWIDPWLDEEKLLPGQNWDMEIEKTVEAADVVIVFLSNNSVTKDGYIQKELRFVLGISDYKPDEAIFIIPIRLNNVIVPRRLQMWHYVDYFPIDIREGVYVKLLKSFREKTKSFGLSENRRIRPAKFVKSDMKAEYYDRVRILELRQHGINSNEQLDSSDIRPKYFDTAEAIDWKIFVKLRARVLDNLGNISKDLVLAVWLEVTPHLLVEALQRAGILDKNSDFDINVQLSSAAPLAKTAIEDGSLVIIKPRG